MSVIWLLDDNVWELELVCKALARVVPTAQVRRAATAEQIEGLWEQETPDVFLLDYMLAAGVVTPHLESWRERSPATVFLVWSGRQDSDTRKECLNHGAYAYFIQPHGFAALCASLQEHVLPHVSSAPAYGDA